MLGLVISDSYMAKKKTEHRGEINFSQENASYEELIDMLTNILVDGFLAMKAKETGAAEAEKINKALEDGRLRKQFPTIYRPFPRKSAKKRISFPSSSQ